VLNASEEFSEFVKYASLFHLDTIINSNKIKTLFVPTNEAMNEFLSGDTTGFAETLKFHIVPSYYMVRNVESNQFHRLKTLDGKFAVVNNINNKHYFEGNEILYSSPMHLDGKYYRIGKVALPRPNIYELIKRNNPSVQRYIDLQDSIVLNRELSKPIGFNENGQTVYDSVTTVINKFEEKYFAISREFRNIYATVALPGRDLYENALTAMAQNIGGQYSTFEDIPAQWENSVLIPSLLNKGVFSGLLSPEDFLIKKMPNVAGDSVIIDYKIIPASQYVCSNGLVYEYESFTIAENLYKLNRLEGESFCKLSGSNQLVWDEQKVTIIGASGFQPLIQRITGASNDTVVSVNFTYNYKQPYSLKFKVANVFPGKYRLVWRTNFRTNGVFSIYVNGVLLKLGLVGNVQYDTSQLSSGFFSVKGNKLFPDSKGFCNVDAWVNDITEFGDVTIEIKYLSSGKSPDNGIVIDYLELVSE
jgi:hypothetical protein